MVTRRELLTGVAAFSGSAAASFAFGGGKAAARAPVIALPIANDTKQLLLDLAERPAALPCFDGKTLPLWTFKEGSLYPIVRMKLGERLETHYKNNLPRAGEYVSLHWHGLRIPNDQDGVPFMTQKPIEPGDSGTYSFVPPDTGSFFFHTHCNTAEHFGRGLVGALIIEGDEIEPSDAEYVLMMKDWRLSPEGTFLPFSTDAGAAKAGTSGTVRSVNGERTAVFKVPSSANVRIRFYNVDPTRISEIGFEDAEAAIIAIDGNGLDPLPLVSWRMGPAMRIDILLRTAPEGVKVRLVDFFAKEPVVLAEFVSEGPAKRSGAFVPAPLKVMPFPNVDVGNAQIIPLIFSATATGEALAEFAKSNVEIGSLCLTKRTFWAINKQAWSSVDHRDLGPPLAVLKSGQSYIFDLQNTTPHSHPVHIHGHTFEVMSSSMRHLPPHRADTILLRPNERVQAGIVGGQPGKWMFHCHIIDHQETGMMGYIEVT